MLFNKPALGFNFNVTTFPTNPFEASYAFIPSDSFFQSVSGIKATVGETVVVNSGFNNSQYKLPTGTTYPDLVLTRGLTNNISDLGYWCHNFLNQQGQQYDKIQTRTVTVMLLGGSILNILMAWNFYDCYPKELEVGAFNADKSELAIETLTIAYSRMEKMSNLLG
jgi:phage tail-like protein|tara:strand:- start:480 stop:977 length:498 start_codon:yes stop_codon:yes gene_type:complete